MLDPLSICISNGSFNLQNQRPSLPRRFLLCPAPDHPDDYVLSLDYSHGLSTYLECPRRYENLNIHSREAARPTIAKDFGTLFHACEELRLRSGLTPGLVEKQMDLVRNYFLSHPVPPDEYRHADRMLELLGQYNKLYTNDGWPEAVISHDGKKAVEIPFKIELCTIPMNCTVPYPREQILSPVSPTQSWRSDISNCGTEKTAIANLHVVFTGKIDAILQNSNFLWVVDHKTSSRGGKEFVEAFDLSLQTRGYCWAAQKILGLPIAGLIMNAVVVRPPTKTGKGTDFDRHTYFYSQESLSEWEQNAKDVVESIVTSLSKGFFRQSARSFKSPCAGCDFQDNCKLPPHQRAADLSSALYNDVTWSPTNEVSLE